MSEQKHTKGPYMTSGHCVFSRKGTVCGCGAPRATSYVKYVETDMQEWDQCVEAFKNADRIARALNAFEGLTELAREVLATLENIGYANSNTATERKHIRKLKKLVAACEADVTIEAARKADEKKAGA